MLNFQEFLNENFNPNTAVYDYKKGRNTVTSRLPFDLKKLIKVGAVFVTPAINFDKKSPQYKEWTNEDHTHLITLHNLEEASPDSWIHKAITKKGDVNTWPENFAEELYDGKYNQILWSLQKLKVDPKTVLLDNK